MTKVLKRKPQIENVDVPEKILKQVQVNEDVKDDNEISLNKIAAAPRELNFNKPLNIKIFRANLKSHFNITDVQHFVHVSSQDSSYITRYLDSGGQILELVELLAKIHKDNSNDIATIFSAIHINLLTITSSDAKLIEASTQSCRYLLKSYRNFFESLLKSTDTNHNKITIKLMTIIVSLNIDLGKSLLSIFDILSEDDLKRLTQNIRFKDNKNEETLRVCFIHFVLSYIVEGHSILIRKLLEKAQILQNIFEGLVNDDHNTVVMFIDTFNKYILKNSQISKTEKFHLFNVNLIVDITKLYHWTGPIKFEYTKKKNDTTNVNPEHLDVVCKSVHSFLKTLLTSVKYGIAVPAIIKHQGKTNSVQKRVLGLIRQNWNDEYLGNLIISILQTCPELIEYFFLKSSKSFANDVDILIKLIESQNPRFLSYCKNEIRIVDVKDILISICFSSTLFDQVIRLIENNDELMKLKAKRLLLAMFRHFKLYYDAIVEWNVFKDHEFLHIRIDALKRITDFCPTIDTMVASLFEIKNNFSQHFEITLDLLQIIHNLFPKFIEKTSSTINYVQILKPILNSSGTRDVKLELKIIKFMLDLEPESISPSAEFFEDVFKTFVTTYVVGDEEEKVEVSCALIKILQNTGLFENGIDEIDIWLNALNSFGENLDEISEFLIMIIKGMKTSSDIFTVDPIFLQNASTDDAINLDDMFAKIENGETIQGIMEGPNLSSIFIVAVKNDTHNPIILEYLRKIGLHLYFYLPVNSSIKNLIKISSKSYKSDNKANSLINIYYNIYKFLQNSDDEQITKIIDSIKTLNLHEKSRILRYIFCHHLKILQNFNISEPIGLTTKLIIEITEQFDVNFEMTRYYRSKIVSQISEIDETNAERILNIFKLNDENCIEILKQPNINSTVIRLCLKRLSELRNKYLNANVILQLTNNLNESIEESLFEYLQVFPHSVQFITADVYQKLFNHEKPSKIAIKLLNFLLERSTEYNKLIVNLIDEHLTHKELVFPILGVALKKNIEFPPKLINKIYVEFKNGINKSIEKPLKAGTIYRENVYTSIELINLCMATNECLDFCKKSLKFDSTDIWQTILIREIHLKTIKSYKNDVESAKLAFINFICNWIQMMNIYLKKESITSNSDKLSSMVVIIFNWINDLKVYFESKNLSFSKITTAQYWLQFCRNILKFGITTDGDQSKLLKCLAYLCEHFYFDNDTNNDLANLFEMTISHSQFFDIILSTERDSKSKLHLVHLLYVLAKKNVLVVDSKHIPVYLGAYNATLSKTDQYLLGLIQLYEKSGVSLYEFRPFLWGESAITHYALREDFQENRIIAEPPMHIVQSLFDSTLCENTMQNFPIWRTLETSLYMPKINFDEFECDIENEYRPGKFYQTLNTIEKIVEKGIRFFDKNILKIAPSKSSTYDNIYDPAFIVPLMGQIFSPESFSSPSITAQNGSLGILIVSLSSPDVNLRLAAGNALLRYRQHFENNRRFLDQRLWSHLFDSLQNGLGEISSKQQGIVPRIPLPSCLFLAKLVNTLSYPQSRMYTPLTNFLLLSDTFDFDKLPEFKILFHSAEVEHVNYRYYILNILKNSIKNTRDFHLLHSTHILQFIMSFFSAAYSDKTVDLLILSTINNCVKIPRLTKIMIELLGLQSWLLATIEKTSDYKYDTIDGIVNIISNIWYSTVITKPNLFYRNDVENFTIAAIIRLLPKLTQQISLKSLSKILNILARISKLKLSNMTKMHIEKITDIAKHHFSAENLRTLDYIRNERVKIIYLDTHMNYSKHLKASGVEELQIFALTSFREFIINWIEIEIVNE